MGKKVSDLVLCFSSSFAYSEAAKVWPIYRRLLIIEINRFVKRAFDVTGRARHVVETAEGTRTYSKDAHRVREK